MITRGNNHDTRKFGGVTQPGIKKYNELFDHVKKSRETGTKFDDTYMMKKKEEQLKAYRKKVEEDLAKKTKNSDAEKEIAVATGSSFMQPSAQHYIWVTFYYCILRIVHE